MIMQPVLRAIRKVARGGGQFFRGCELWAQEALERAISKDEAARHRGDVIAGTIAHNMVLEPDEPFYRDQYWHWIESSIGARLGNVSLSALDLGCGQGRITVLLAELCRERGGNVVGVDISPNATEFAREYLKSRHCEKEAEIVCDDVLSFLQGIPAASCNLVVSTELFFVLPSYRDVLKETFRVLSPKGLFLVAVRSRYYNILHSVSNGRFDTLDALLNRNDGYPWGKPAYFTWFDVDDIKKELALQGFQTGDVWGIGACSGIAGDPLAHIARPSRLVAGERERLMALETALARKYADCGRYILVEAFK